MGQRELAANAAERRLRDDQWCPSADVGETEHRRSALFSEGADLSAPSVSPKMPPDISKAAIDSLPPVPEHADIRKVKRQRSDRRVVDLTRLCEMGCSCCSPTVSATT